MLAQWLERFNRWCDRQKLEMGEQLALEREFQQRKKELLEYQRNRRIDQKNWDQYRADGGDTPKY